MPNNLYKYLVSLETSYLYILFEINNMQKCYFLNKYSLSNAKCETSVNKYNNRSHQGIGRVKPISLYTNS